MGLLSLAIWTPIAFGALLLAFGSDKHAGAVRWLALIGALIGFAGPRVIEQTVRETLPAGFQRSEFLLEKGALDLIIDRRELRDRLAELLTLLTRQASVRSVA